MFKAGDILGFSGDGWLSAGINLATLGVPYWSLSHVAIVGDDRGRLLYESTMQCDLPCKVAGHRVNGTQVHDIEERVSTYRGKVWHYPLYRPLFTHERNRLREFLNSHLGRSYDAIGAFRSGDYWSTVEAFLREDDLTSIFCSELCAAAHCSLGIFPTGNRSRWSPNRLCRWERWHGILRKPRRLK